jgi:hypothetical protein
MESLGFNISLKAPQKEIPKRLFSMSRENIIWMLRGMFDGDGCASKNRLVVSYISTSEKLITQTKMLLMNFGVLSSVYSNWSKPNKRVAASSFVYHLEINSCYASTFYGKIGFNLPRKQIRETIGSNRPLHTTSDVIPYSKLFIRNLKSVDKNKYKELLKCGILKGSYAINEHFSRGVLLKYRNDIETIFGDSVSDFLENVRTDIKWEKIQSKELSENRVYDFSMELDKDSKEFGNSVLYSGFVGHQTPVGMNHFYEFWMKAFKKQSNFYPIKVGWWENPNRDKAWKERMIRDIGALRFSQEFQMKFLGSQDTLIDSDVLEQMNVQEVIDLKFGSLMKIYEKPINGEFYVLGVDPATGVGADFSVIQVLRIIDAENIKQVATYRYNKISLYDFAQVCVSVSDYYNEAKMMIENNLGGEDLCNTIWYTHENENIVNFDNIKLGIRATPKSKFSAVMNMKRYIESGWVEICDKDTVDELSRYVEARKGKFGASGSTQHDDLVAGLYWGLYYTITEEFDEEFGSGDDEPTRIKDKYKLNKDDYEDDEQDDDETPTQFYFSD